MEAEALGHESRGGFGLMQEESHVDTVVSFPMAGTCSHLCDKVRN